MITNVVERAYKSYKKPYRDDELVTIKGYGPCPGKFLNNLGRLNYAMESYLLWGDPDWSEKVDSRKDKSPRCVWALIRVGKTHIRAGYNKETGEAYKADGYRFTWEKWKRFEFVRFLQMQEL